MKVGIGERRAQHRYDGERGLPVARSRLLQDQLLERETKFALRSRAFSSSKSFSRLIWSRKSIDSRSTHAPRIAPPIAPMIALVNATGSPATATPRAAPSEPPIPATATAGGDFPSLLSLGHFPIPWLRADVGSDRLSKVRYRASGKGARPVGRLPLPILTSPFSSSTSSPAMTSRNGFRQPDRQCRRKTARHTRQGDGRPEA